MSEDFQINKQFAKSFQQRKRRQMNDKYSEKSHSSSTLTEDEYGELYNENV